MKNKIKTFDVEPKVSNQTKLKRNYKQFWEDLLKPFLRNGKIDPGMNKTIEGDSMIRNGQKITISRTVIIQVTVE